MACLYSVQILQFQKKHPSSDQGCCNQCWPQTDSVTVAEILALEWCGAGGKYIDYSVSVGCFSSQHFEST